ncbi:MAG: hypothetical protein V1918_10685 [Planctomycetota bacterium]
MRGEILPYAPVYYEALMRFFAATCPELTPLIWEAKYGAPSGPAPGRFAERLWVEGDRVLGHGAWWIVTVMVDGEPFQGAWFLDWHVAPDARGIGGGKALMAAFPEEADLLLAARGSAASQARFSHWGWKKPAMGGVYLLPLAADLLARRRHLEGLRALPARVIGCLASWSASPKKPDLPQGFVFQVHQGTLEPRIEPAVRNGVPRSKEAYAYIAGFPSLDCVSYSLDREGRTHAWMAAAFHREEGGLLCANILDVAWEEGAPDALLAAFLRAAALDLKSCDAAAAECLSTGKTLTRVLESCRFLRRDEACLWARPLTQKAGQALARGGEWRFSFFDSDLFLR